MAAVNKLQLIASISVILRRRRRRRYKASYRKIWTRPWLLRRPIYGAYHTLLIELEEQDLFSYKNYVRMVPHNFQYICELITPLIQKQDTNWRKAISVGERLALTLRYLATGTYIVFYIDFKRMKSESIIINVS